MLKSHGLVIPGFADRPQIHAFFNAWNAWRDGAVAPKRNAINLRDIPNLLRACMLMDIVSPEDIRFRYVGSMFQDLYGFDFTGANYIELSDSDIRELRSLRLTGVADQPAAAVWTIPPAYNNTFVGASVPILQDDKDKPRQIMQVLVPDNEVTSGVYRDRSPHNLVFSDHFRYIDIGAGVPDTNLES